MGTEAKMGICRDSRHKRRHTGGKRKSIKKKRKFELGRPMASTKLGAKRIHMIRTRGGNEKRRAMRLEQGNFSWGSEVSTHKTRILDVVYNASDNDLLRTKTLVKNAIVQIDATPFKLFYVKHYGLSKDFFNQAKGDSKFDDKARSKKAQRKIDAYRKQQSLDSEIEDQLRQGRFLACISSRPGQSGRADGYILEGPELAFYKRKLKSKK